MGAGQDVGAASAANDDVQQWIDREFFETNIDSETCTAKWYAGERWIGTSWLAACLVDMATLRELTNMYRLL